MNDIFTNRTMKWGLLRRVARKGSPWSFVNSARHLFDNETEALQRANDMMIPSGAPNYLYKPVEVLLKVEVDKQIKEPT